MEFSPDSQTRYPYAVTMCECSVVSNAVPTCIFLKDLNVQVLSKRLAKVMDITI